MPKFHLKKNTTHPDLKETHYIHIDDGELAGMCFLFGKIEFMGEDEDGNGRVMFDYDLISMPEHITLNEDTKKQVEAEVSVILNEIIINSLEQNADEIRNTDSDELTA